MWRLEDGKQMATVDPEAEEVPCLAGSKDGRWVAAVTLTRYRMSVWDAKTYEKVISHKGDHSVNGVDFSPDSTRLVSALSNWTACIWDIGALAAKYSARGDRIATATKNAVRVWDSERSLVDIPVKVEPCYNTGLHWLNRLTASLNPPIHDITGKHTLVIKDKECCSCP